MTRDQLLTELEKLAKKHGWKIDRFDHNGRQAFDLQQLTSPAPKRKPEPYTGADWHEWKRRS